MPLQNRVTPLGELIAASGRGLVYGNRGCLHDEHQQVRRRYATKRWIACRLQFRGRHRPRLMAPGRYTELFFLDEATALAAGHRPCAECRREDYLRLIQLWSSLHPAQHGADDIDAQLHSERLVSPRERRYHTDRFGELPDGAYVLHNGEPCLVLAGRLLPWSPDGYTTPRRRPPAGAEAVVITPRSLVALLREAWHPVVPLLHPSAGG